MIATGVRTWLLESGVGSALGIRFVRVDARDPSSGSTSVDLGLFLLVLFFLGSVYISHGLVCVGFGFHRGFSENCVELGLA